MSKAVVVISGGLDSTVLAHKVADFVDELYGISFDYGQRHKKELEFAAFQLDEIGAKDHKIVDLTSITDLFAGSGSSLVTNSDVPEGHYGEESMKSTVVPNRNMIMLSIAAGYAVSLNAGILATGVHAGDHFIYPDCRPEFIQSAEETIRVGNEGLGPFQGWEQDTIAKSFLYTPFIKMSKNYIAAQAFKLNVNIAKTWSCYKGGEIHCGKCGTCVERLEAIASTGKVDPTVYEDDQFWREALQRETV